MVTQFLDDGWIVFATLRHASERKDIFADELRRHSDRLVVLNLDITSAADRQSVLDTVTKHGSGLDCLINNAGSMSLGAFEATEEQQIRRAFEVNFFGTVLLTQQFLPLLRRNSGTIINISSIFGVLTWPLTSVYCSTKFALEGWSQSIAQELLEAGVRVVVIEPGSQPGTNLSAKVEWGSRPIAPPDPYSLHTAGYRALRIELGSRPGDGSGAVGEAALRVLKSRRNTVRVQVGFGTWALCWLTRLSPRWAGFHLMREVARRLFLHAEKRHSR